MLASAEVDAHDPAICLTSSSIEKFYLEEENC